MYLSIDFIEENIAYCINDDGEACAVPLELIKGNPKEGTVLFLDENEKFTIDNEEEERRRESNFNLAESLFDE